MPVVIEQLSTSFETRDEARLRRLIQKEIERYLGTRAGVGKQRSAADPADPAASGAPQSPGGS